MYYLDCQLTREEFFGLLNSLWVSIKYESLVLRWLGVEPVTKESGEYLVIESAALIPSLIDRIQQFLVVGCLPRIIVFQVYFLGLLLLLFNCCLMSQILLLQSANPCSSLFHSHISNCK